MQSDPSTYATSHSLIELIQRNDAEAWSRLYHVYSPLVAVWVRKAGLSDAAADDVGQEVFRIVAGSIQRFRHDRPEDTFRGWLLTITRNELRGFFRDRARHADWGEGGSTALLRLNQVPEWVEREDSIDPSVGDQSVEQELMRRAAEVVRRDFADHTWQAFWRSVVEGHDAAEIAKDLGMTPNAVRQAKFRVLARLKETVADL